MIGGGDEWMVVYGCMVVVEGLGGGGLFLTILAGKIDDDSRGESQ